MSNQIELIKWFLIREAREIYHSRTMILTTILTTIITLGIYWFTARAFAPSIESGLQGYNIDYFTYILIGDLTFLIPSLMFVGAADSIRRCAADRSLENMLTSRTSPRKIILLQMVALLPIEFLKAGITLSIAMIFFNFKMPALSFSKILFLQILSLPLFMGLGLIAASVLLRFSRGEGVIGQLSSLGVIFAGAYFPLAVFPDSIQWLTSILSPFTLILEGTRNLVNEDSNTAFLPLGMIILLWGVLTFFLGSWLIQKGLEYNRKKGAPYLFFR